jgi:hypothetical protein
MSSKAQVDELFTKTVEDWARFYSDPKPATLSAQNLVSRRRFALEMLEARVPPGIRFTAASYVGPLSKSKTKCGR